MEKIPAATDSKQADSKIDLDAESVHGLGRRLFGQAPTEPSKELIAHWRAEGERSRAEQDWVVSLKLSEIPIEDYELKREHVAKGRFRPVEELDELYQPDPELKREHVLSMGELDWLDNRKELSKAWAWPLQTMETWRKDAAAEAKKATKASQQDRKAKAPERERQGSVVAWPEPEPWPEPVDGAALLDEIVGFVKTFVSLSDHQASATALWAAMTWLHEDLDISAFLHVTSATKRCGKSLLAGEVLPAFLRRAFQVSGSVTPAALFRIVEKDGPALLVDEVDTFLKDSPELRGLINGAHRKAGAFTIRCEGDDNEVRRFRTFSPKLLAGIGRLPDTIADRAIRITLKRRAPGGAALPLWRDRDREQIDALQRKIARWIGDNREAILQDRGQVQFPPTLDDRQRDCWEALLAIADRAGGPWPKRAYAAAEELSQSDIDEDSARELLIHHVKDVFAEMGAPPAIHTKDLLDRLIEIEGAPWGDWKQGRPITARGLSSLLRDFNIRSRGVRIAEIVKKGYRFDDFEDTWKSYSQKKGGTPPYKRLQRYKPVVARVSAISKGYNQKPM